MFKIWLKQRRVFNAEDGAGGGGGTETTTGTETTAGQTTQTTEATTTTTGEASAKWWEGLSDPHKSYLTPKGLTLDDPVATATKLIDIASNAEKRIGKGLDAIMDRPAKGQDYGEWARANAEVLGLPAETAGYEVKAPQDWPKDLPWDAENEAKAREIAFKYGVPPEAHKAYIGFQAEIVRGMDKAAAEQLDMARNAMMTDLQKDWGTQTQAKVTRASQAMQFVAEKAGITVEGIQALSQTMSAKTGDAGVLRIFDTIAELMADDQGFAMGRGQQQLGMTAAEARAELKTFMGANGEYGRAFAAGDQKKMAELRPRREHLSKLAAG